ncbi:gaa1-like, GPI transamidase component domain-containing protein [Phthorimaea operculella]|nr:gaa1-like, GPI transamidase component domain-containing protein [Phthorimaea operculella]
MGLLSDPEFGSVKWVRVLGKVQSPISFLCFVGALVWFALLANREFNNETYFSENALLPGLVTNDFNAERSAKQIYKDFLQELEDKYFDTNEMPVPWLVAKMSQIDLEVHTHNFTLNYPFGQGQVYKGTNVYGILRAPRASSLEAIVVSAPYRSLLSHEKGTAAGIALMLAFAEFARPQKYWAKDIIFLITEHEQLGMQAWLEAYHGLQSDKETFYTSLGSFWKPGTTGKMFQKKLSDFGWTHEKPLNPGKLSGRAGSIQAAINLEIHEPKINFGWTHEKHLNPGKLSGRAGSIQAAINLEIHEPKINFGWTHEKPLNPGKLSGRAGSIQAAMNLEIHEPKISLCKKLSDFDWTHEKPLNPGKLSGRAGSIQAAINLEIHEPKINFGWTHEKPLNPGKLSGRAGSIQAAINLEIHEPKIIWKLPPPPLGEAHVQQWTAFGWTHEKPLNPGKLSGRAGSIQAAINLEIHEPKIKYIEVKVEGLNGQLPNLDLVNLVHKLCTKSMIHHSYKNSYSWIGHRNKMDEWKNGLMTMLGMVTTQLAGVPNGNHGLFHRFGIEAVTLDGRDADDANGPAPKVHSISTANFYRLGVALESILRSINNLLERFHQSYFFYLLASTNRFISIGQYMPSLCLLCTAILIRTLSLWVNLQKTDDTDKQTEKIARKQKTSETDVPGDDDITEVVKKDDESTVRRRKTSESEKKEQPPKKETKHKKTKQSKDTSMSIVNVGGNYLLVHLIGYGVVYSLPLLSHIGTTYLKTTPEVAIYYGLLTISVLLVLLTPYLPRLHQAGRMNRQEMTLVNILALIELTTMCLTVGMHNFPLGLVLATVYTPLALIVGVVMKGDRSRFTVVSLFFKRIICILLHPLCIVTLSTILYSKHLVPEESISMTFVRGRDAAIQAIMFSIVDSLIYGNWLFNVMATVVFPTWIIFWQILNIKVES